jgi:CxxC motif-containing protein (DUF1111 family)
LAAGRVLAVVAIVGLGLGSVGCEGKVRPDATLPGPGAVTGTGGSGAQLDPGPVGGAPAGTPPGEGAPPASPAPSATNPPAACADASGAGGLPRVFFTTCSACHSPIRGAVSSGAIPSLYAYAGSAADLVTTVRRGGKAMPAFTPAMVSDSELQEILGYFKGQAPTGGRCDGATTTDRCGGAAPQVTPLFATAGAAATSAPPIVTPIVTIDDTGVIITRGAGRVRGRHETEKTFSLFLPLYFENRSYVFTIEDSVAAGGGTVKFNYTSFGAPADMPLTNLRVWKVYGAGNVFHQNVDMVKVAARASTFTVTANEREHRPMRKGDTLEFEFGIFLSSASVPGRTNYYTDTFRYQVGEGGLTAINTDPSVGALGPGPAGLSGGSTTIPYVVAEPEMSFSQMLLNMQPESVDSFLSGRRLFHTSFATGVHSEPENPLLPAQMGKLGPLFNQESCISCHPHNGRGAPPAPGAAMSAMVVKVFGPPEPTTGASTPHATLGRQLQNHAAAGSVAEGDPSIKTEIVERRLADGTVVALQKPALDWKGPGAPPEHFSLRVARPLVGLGLLEAIPEANILALADPDDCNGDGISGRANLVRDPESGVTRVGRFGWKAAKVSVRHQVAEALLLDMGVTSPVFPDAECPAESSCAKAAPELAEADLAFLTTYMRSLAVSPRRKLEDPQVQRGAVVFAQSGCGSCHLPAQMTGKSHPMVELRDQIIYPYTDLLLHDMGPDLADASEREYVAGPSEWRTPPLWSIGLTNVVNGNERYLHDGRAGSLLEAILWHGGEASGARERVVALPTADRAALLDFLGSL